MDINFEFLDSEYKGKISQRAEQYQKAIDYYKKSASADIKGAEIVFEEDTALTLSYLYFHWLHVLVKPFIHDLCDRYKVASITELAICYLRPISVERYDNNQQKLINADFAFFCAMNIMVNFIDETDSVHFGSYHLRPFTGAIAPLEDRMEKILENHKRYLTTFDDTNITPPIIANAFGLELVDMFYTFRWQALGI